MKIIVFCLKVFLILCAYFFIALLLFTRLPNYLMVFTESYIFFGFLIIICTAVLWYEIHSKK